MVPEAVLAELHASKEEAAEKIKEEAAKRNRLPVNIYTDERALCLSVDKTETWGTVKAKILEGFGGLEGLGVLAADCTRLRTIQYLQDDCPGSEIPAESDDVACCKVLKTYGATELYLDTKEPGAEWPREYGEFGVPGTYQYNRVMKMALYTPPEAGTESGGSMSAWKTIVFGYKCTIGDMRRAAAENFGLPAECVKFGKLLHGKSMHEVVGEDTLLCSLLRHPITCLSGDRVLLLDSRTPGVSISDADFTLAAEEADNRANLHFTELDGELFTHHLAVSKKTLLPDYKEAIAQVLGLSADAIALHNDSGMLITYPTQVRRQRMLVRRVTAASAAQASRSHVLPVYLFKGDRENLSARLFDVEVHLQ